MARTEHAQDPTTHPIWSDQDPSVLCRDGSELSVDFTLSPLKVAGNTRTGAAIRDNSARRVAEHARDENQ